MRVIFLPDLANVPGLYSICFFPFSFFPSDVIELRSGGKNEKKNRDNHEHQDAQAIHVNLLRSDRQATETRRKFMEPEAKDSREDVGHRETHSEDHSEDHMLRHCSDSTGSSFLRTALCA